MRVFFVESSGNSKTGAIPVSYISKETCPTACPLSGRGGCYAGSGPVSLQWKKTKDPAKSISWDEYLVKLGKIEKGRLVRHGVAGDLPGEGDRLDTEMLGQLVNASRRIRLYGYTHKPLTGPGEAEAMAEAVAGGLSLSLSADSLQEADRKISLGVAPVVTLLPSDPASWPSHTPEGRRIVVCPHTTHGVQCIDCRLCAVPQRRALVGFPSHGSGKKKAEAAFFAGS